MKRVYLTTAMTCLAVLLFFGIFCSSRNRRANADVLTVGFLYEDDESTPYTWNFALAEDALKEAYPGRVVIFSKSNVPMTETEEPLRELAMKGCRIIFTNSHSEDIITLAPEYPQIQFCQVSYLEEAPLDSPDNYHTFKGEIYQGRYVSGIAAGLKLKEMIDQNIITPQQALVGYVGSYSSAAVISGYTAFLLGVRSIVPEAEMKVRYTNTWSSYSREKTTAKELIADGCVIISQHSDTIGPAVACEEASAQQPVYFAGYNQSMIDIAPASSLISTRINWTRYILGAVEAMFSGEKIEKKVSGHVHGNDISAGFEEGWVEMLDLNTHVAVEGTLQKMEEAIEALKKGKLQVFKGDYIGTNPEDPFDTYDLSKGFTENETYSSPAFHYVLKDIIEVEW